MTLRKARRDLDDDVQLRHLTQDRECGYSDRRTGNAAGE